MREADPEKMTFESRYRPLRDPAVLAFVVAASILAGLAFAVSRRGGAPAVLVGIALIVLAAAAAALVAIIRGRVAALTVTRDALIWQVRFGEPLTVRWSEVRRVVALTRRGRTTGCQLVTDQGSFLVVTAHFEHARRLAATLELRGALRSREDDEEEDPAHIRPAREPERRFAAGGRR